MRHYRKEVTTVKRVEEKKGKLVGHWKRKSESWYVTFIPKPKLCIPSTLNIDLILWQTQSIVCAENIKSWTKS